MNMNQSVSRITSLALSVAFVSCGYTPHRVRPSAPYIATASGESWDQARAQISTDHRFVLQRKIASAGIDEFLEADITYDDTDQVTTYSENLVETEPNHYSLAVPTTDPAYAGVTHGLKVDWPKSFTGRTVNTLSVRFQLPESLLTNEVASVRVLYEGANNRRGELLKNRPFKVESLSGRRWFSTQLFDFSTIDRDTLKHTVLLTIALKGRKADDVLMQVHFGVAMHLSN